MLFLDWEIYLNKNSNYYKSALGKLLTLKISKKSLYHWLIGGLSSAVVGLLFVKVTDIVNFTWKSKYFVALKREFDEKGPPGTLIEWRDSNGWEKFYKEQLKTNNNVQAISDNSVGFRDYCYEKTEEEAKKLFENCWAENGWCWQCIKLERLKH